MGPTKATNSAKLVAKTITDIGVSVYQGCNTAITEDQSLTVTATDGSTINIGDIDWTQVVNSNIACVQSSTTSTAIDNAIEQAAQQTASATNQEFNISGETESNNTVTQIEAVKNAISLAFQQECTGLISQNQNVNFTAADGSTVTVGNLNWQQTADAVSQCVQDTDAVTNATNSLSQSLEQTATATVESFLGPFIAIIIVIVIVIGLIIYKGVGAVTNWRFLLVVGGAVVLYFIAALIFKWPPFQKKSSDSNSSNGSGSGSGSGSGGSS